MGLANLYPQIMLAKMNEGDIYHWCDVGCHFNIKGISRLKEYIEIVKKMKKVAYFFHTKSQI